MQVVFTFEEFRILVHVLREISENTGHPSTFQQTSASAILEKVLARDFSFTVDELDDMEEFLKDRQARMTRDLADPACSQMLEKMHEQAIIERMLDRVTEACAMA